MHFVSLGDVSIYAPHAQHERGQSATIKLSRTLGGIILCLLSEDGENLNLTGWEIKKKSKSQCGIFKPNDSIPVFLLADHFFCLLGKA